MNVTNETVSAMTLSYLTVMLLKIAIILTVIVIIYYVTLLCNRRTNLLHIPGPHLLPIVGNALLFAGDHLHFLPIMKYLIGKKNKQEKTILTHFNFSPVWTNVQTTPWVPTQPSDSICRRLPGNTGQYTTHL